MEFKHWLEATTDYTEKIVDPALLTYEEFWEKVNPRSKSHSSDAYDWSLPKFKQTKDKYPTLLFRKEINGVSFEFRMLKQDNYQDNLYVKYDPDGDIVRINSLAQYYTREELLKMGKYRRFSFDFGVFHGNQCVGVSQDEWGCLLVSVASEYRGFGLGPVITKLAWEAEPGKDTGGCTPKGAGVVRKVHAEFVHEYLQKGFYSLLVKQGKLTAQRAQQIIASASLQSKPKQQRNYGTDDPENWLLFHENGIFILYDKRLKDIYQDEDGYWKDKCIKAVGDVGGMMHENENYLLRRIGGDTEGLKKFMLLCCVTWTAEEDGKPLLVYEEDLPLVDTTQMKVKKDRKNGWVSLITEPLDYKPMERAEKKWRKQFDKYDEFRIILMEIGSAKYD